MVEDGLSYKIANIVYGQILSDSPNMAGQTTDKEKNALKRLVGDIVARNADVPVREDPIDREFRLGMLRSSLDMSFSEMPLPSYMSDSKGGINIRFGGDFPVESEYKPNEFTAIFGSFNYKGEIPVGEARDYFGPFFGNAKKFVSGICEDYCSNRGCDIIMPFYFKTLGLDVPKGTDLELLFLGEDDSLREKRVDALKSNSDLKAVVKDFKYIHGMPYRRKDSFRDVSELGNREKDFEKERGLHYNLMIFSSGYRCLYAEGIAIGENWLFMDRTNLLNCLNYPLSPDDKYVIDAVINKPVVELIELRRFGSGEFNFNGLSKRLSFITSV